MVLDPRTLKSSIPPKQISEPTPCRFCGYDLIGLMNNGSCPECGKAIRPHWALRLGTDHMTDAPLEYLRILGLGTTLMFLGWAGLMVSLGVLTASGVGAVAVAYAGSGIAWWTGIMMVARPRPASETTTENRMREWLGLRIAALITQAFWVLSAGLTFVWLTATGGAPGVLGNLAVMAGGIASLGLVPVCLFIANLAYWASDTTVGIILRTLTVFVPLVPLTCVFMVGQMIPTAWTLLHGIQAPVVLIMLGMAVVMITPPLVFTWCLWSFRQTCAWAITNHRRADEKVERLRQRAMREAAMGGLPPSGVDSTTLPGYHLASTSETAPPAVQKLAPGNRVKGLAKKKSGEPNPYELAEE